jgi:hypothetical protein
MTIGGRYRVFGHVRSDEAVTWWKLVLNHLGLSEATYWECGVVICLSTAHRRIPGGDIIP